MAVIEMAVWKSCSPEHEGFLSIKMLLLALCVSLACVVATTAASSPLNSAKAGVVRVIAGPKTGEGEFSSGTGFAVTDGVFVTNKHVVETALANPDEDAVWIVSWNTGGSPVIVAVQVSSTADLAILKTDDVRAPALPFAASPPDAGEAVEALGYPGQMDAVLDREELAKPGPPDVTVGALINSGRSQSSDAQQLTKLVHSASLWPGNSGGPLLDKCGRVIGINTWIHAEGGLTQQNIAISANDLLKFLSDQHVLIKTDQRTCNDGTLSADQAAPVSPPAAARPLPAPQIPTRRPQHDNSLLIIFLFAIGVFVLAGGLLAFTGRSGGQRPGSSPSKGTSSQGW